MLDLMREKTRERLDWLANGFPRAMGVYAVDPSDPENALKVNADVVFPTASSIKIAILAEFIREAGLIRVYGRPRLGAPPYLRARGGCRTSSRGS